MSVYQGNFTNVVGLVYDTYYETGESSGRSAVGINPIGKTGIRQCSGHVSAHMGGGEDSARDESGNKPD